MRLAHRELASYYPVLSVIWLIARVRTGYANGSRVHLARPLGSDREDGNDENDFVPLCSHTPFTHGAEEGYGAEAAQQTGKAWCDKGLKKTSPSFAAQLIAGASD